MKQYEDIYQLAQKARERDLEALSRLVDSVRMCLFSTAFAITNNYADAQDAVANSIVKICMHIGDLREPSGIVAWMNRIVKREALRLCCTRNTVSLTDYESNGPQNVIHSTFRIDVERALHQLPANHATAIQLFYFHTLSVEEIAAEMSTQCAAVNIGQVKTWLHRGKKQLAGAMKGYNDEMKQKTAKSKPRAALICSNLSASMITVITDAMREGGLQPEVILGADIPGCKTNDGTTAGIWSKGHITQSTLLVQLFKKYSALVFDEQIDHRSGLEFVLFCKSSADTVQIPITLLHSQAADAIFIAACATVGITHLVDKSNIASIAAAFRKPVEQGIWRNMSDDAKAVMYFSQEEAKKLHDNYLSTEHLALGLMRDPTCPGSKILETICGTSIESVRAELNKHLQKGPGHNEALGMQLTPRSKLVIDLSYEEARQAGSEAVGSEHILLGLIIEHEGLAGKVLKTMGVKLDQVRIFVAQSRR